MLPTSGAARIRGGLSSADFVKVISVQELTPPALRQLAPAITTLARAEGLEAHARSRGGASWQVRESICHRVCLQPREAVLNMAPYSPPTGGRAGKLRLDFNENTVGASPKVIEYLREHLSEAGLAIYPEYSEIKQELAEFFGVEPDDFILTNGTDEAIQVLINTYIDDGDEVLLLRPSYAMYRFYAEVAGASIREIPYRAQKLAFPLEELLDAIRPSTRAILIANPNNPTGTGTSRAGHRTNPRKSDECGGFDRRSLLRILAASRRCRCSTTIRICLSAGRSRKFTAWRRCGWAACFRSRAMSSFCTRRSRLTA